MFCPKCNTENNDDAKFCKNCGATLNDGFSQDAAIRQNAQNNQSALSDNRNMIIIGLAVVLCAVIIVGAMVLMNNNNGSSESAPVVNEGADDSVVTADQDDSSSSSAAESSSLKIQSGSIRTGNDLSDKTYCSVYVGSEHAGEACKISVLYSRDGSNLNQGKIVPKTVSSDGYVSVPSADAFKYYPDKALITIYDANGNKLDSLNVNLVADSGTQNF